MKSPVILIIKGHGQFSSLLRERGFRILNLELIETKAVEDLSELEIKLDHIDEYDGLFITSPVAAEILVRQLDRAGRRFNGKVYVLGARARKLLVLAGLDVIFRGSANTAADLIGAFERTEFAGKRLLFIRGDKSLRTIPQLLDSTADIDEVTVYQTLERGPDESLIETVCTQLRDGAIHWICFFSPSGVESFVKLTGSDLASKTAVAVIGETTARTAREAGLNVKFVAKKAGAEEFAESFAEHLKTID